MKREELLLRERPPSHYRHMDISRRAKQFAPFAALKGFEDIIREERKKADREEKREPAEEFP